MQWKKLGAALLFPPIAPMILLLPISTVFLIGSMLYMEELSPLRISSYVLAFYTLVIWCIRMPRIFRFFRGIKNQNRYIQTWFGDHRLRINVTLCGNVLWNGAYAALQLGLGLYHSSAWFYSLSAYYASLAMMRFFLVRHTLRHQPGEQMKSELTRYRACGRIFLLMNLALSAMMFYMLRQNRTVEHNEIITIAMAAYTFTSLTMSIINVIRYRKYNSPAISAAKAISLASACVSMLTLENTMLATFSGEEMTPQVQKLFLALSGGAISLFIIVMALYMIIQANRKMKLLGESCNGK